MERYERILGGLFGVACGDALGGTPEFMSKDGIERKYGYLKDIITVDILIVHVVK